MMNIWVCVWDDPISVKAIKTIKTIDSNIRRPGAVVIRSPHDQLRSMPLLNSAMNFREWLSSNLADPGLSPTGFSKEAPKVNEGRGFINRLCIASSKVSKTRRRSYLKN
jgi:hypothetical protein